MKPPDRPKAKANPTKAFFVKMITRDIALEDCIFDLIDNSIDGAWKLAGGRPMRLDGDTDLTPYKISIEVKKDRFSIQDNCGGISRYNATNYAFTFGRAETAQHDNFSIGVYGIGMKRAVFKIGSKINIRSTFLDHHTLSSFQVPIDVDAWLGAKDGNWEFEIYEADDLDEAGVLIDVTQLNEAATQLFNSPRFIQDLRRIIARDYALHLHRGLTIELQGKPITGWSINLRRGGEFMPMRKHFLERREDEEVFVEILAGMEAPPPEDSNPDGDWHKEQNRSGWYVICNGRVVLAADKTTLTGWGTDDWPQWHPQYSGFMGFIIFSSQRADLLPLTTTKRSVDTTSSLYRYCRPKMREVSKDWINYTNARKQRDKEEVAQQEKEAKTVPIFEVAARPNVVLPQVAINKLVRPANVHYSVSKVRLRKLANALGDINMSYTDVGRKSFEYTFEELVGDE